MRWHRDVATGLRRCIVTPSMIPSAASSSRWAAAPSMGQHPRRDVILPCHKTGILESSRHHPDLALASSCRAPALVAPARGGGGAERARGPRCARAAASWASAHDASQAARRRWAGGGLTTVPPAPRDRRGAARPLRARPAPRRRRARRTRCAPRCIRAGVAASDQLLHRDRCNACRGGDCRAHAGFGRCVSELR
jgi:hypothetical protein